MLRKIINIIKGDFSFAYVGGTDLISSALGAAFWLYFASIVAVDDYGQITFLISTSTLAFTISSLGMSYAVLTFLPKGRTAILQEVNSLLLISALAAATVVGIVSNNAIVSIFVVSLVTYLMSTTELLAKTKHKEYGIISIGNKAVQIGLSLFLYFLIGVNGFILGYAISNFVFSYRFVALLRQFTVKFEELKKIWKFSMHIFLSNLASDMRFHWDKILIGAVFGYYVLGSYQFSFQFYSILSILIGSFVRYLLPYESGGTIKKNFKILSIVMIGSIVTTIVLAAPYAIPVFYPQYVQSITAVQILTLAIVPQALSSLVSVKLMAENKKTLYLLISILVANTSYIGMLLILGSILDIAGLAISLLVASIIQMSFMLVMVRGRIY